MFFFKKNVRVVVRNQNLALELKLGTNLYEALVREGVIPQTLCRGNGQCGKCKVHITQKNIARPNKKEQLVLARINLDAGFRLACQTTIREDMVIDTSEIMSNNAPADVFTVRPLKSTPQEAHTGQASDIPTPVDPSPQPAAPAPQEAVAERIERVVTPPVEKREKPKESKKSEPVLDGLLLIANKKQIRYFLYSAVIDSVAQEGVLESEEPLSAYINNGTIMDYIHDSIKITEIDRLIIFCDEPAVIGEGEELFDIVSYRTFDIGALPCEIIQPLSEARKFNSGSDFSLFLRLLATKGKKRLLLSLDRLDHSYYIAEDKLIHLPFTAGTPANLFELCSNGENPVIDISDDLKVITPQKAYYAPDSLPLPMAMKLAMLLVKKKLANAELKMTARTALPSDTPLDYIVKMVSYEGENAFFLRRSKDGDLMITQKLMDALANARNYMHWAVEYTESKLGNIENIIICTPAVAGALSDSMATLNMLPARYHGMMLHNPGDSVVMAVKLFQEQDVRSYIHKNYGTYIKSEV
ncbi:MAG: 2Fe-2S iron-sulfur cluster binding domain-containing protein [Deferribacteraceae bacterium]|jgi:ferredoxin|nr:2Fe-2S iron-sulfur cluster binding domain-containing protein [Deferribacteraceae bacterium]